MGAWPPLLPQPVPGAGPCLCAACPGCTLLASAVPSSQVCGWRALGAWQALGTRQRSGGWRSNFQPRDRVLKPLGAASTSIQQWLMGPEDPLYCLLSP